jgi:hypothetical protein
MKIYYKVTNQNLKSCTTTHYNIPDKYKIQYKVNEKVFGADDTPLFVFKTLEDAKEFVPRIPCREPRFFKCEVTKPRKIKYLSYLADISMFFSFIRNKQLRKKHKEYEVFSPTEGTLAVDSVKLLEEVFI